MYTIRERKFQLFGHICKMPNDRLLYKDIDVKHVGRRRTTRTTTWRWIDNISMWCGRDIKGAVMMTEDRDNWSMENIRG